MLSLLRAHGVVPLHGPPRHPRYYGQLERQNRDLRACLDALGRVPAAVLAARCGPLRQALNECWPRHSLGWRTPASVWKERRAMTIDRQAFREDIAARAARLVEQGTTQDLAARFAIEQALVDRGLMHIKPPRRVLRG